MQYAPTRVRAKPAQFHISTHVPAKNAPDFILSNKDTPKTRPILGANPCRRTFRGVCFCALHGYVHNSSSFIFPNRDTPKTHPVLGLNLRRRTFRGVCFCAPTRVRAKPAQFHISTHVPAKNAPGFIFPNRDTPKTRPVLDPNLRRGTFWGRMLLRPTWVRAKFGGFHISAPGYVKNAPDFTHPQ